MNDEIYNAIKTTYTKSMMDIFVVLELDIKDRFKQHGVSESKDHKKLAHKLLTDIINEHYASYISSK